MTGTQIYDGLLRARQSQAQAPIQFGETELGRIITDTTAAQAPKRSSLIRSPASWIWLS